jgi:hypothetical protein
MQGTISREKRAPSLRAFANIDVPQRLIKKTNQESKREPGDAVINSKVLLIAVVNAGTNL